MVNVLIFAISFLACAALLLVLLPILRKMKFGQQILEDGPTWHKKKSGTPTMGGMAFLPVLALILLGGVTKEKLMVVLGGALFWLIGFVDDRIKIRHKQNKGLSAKQKFLLQIIASLLFAGALRFWYKAEPVLQPFGWNLGFFFIPFVVLFFLAVTNAVNITDGVDGLATSVSFVNVLFLAVIATQLLQNRPVSDMMIALAGILLAFFCFNHHPARIFMGDTGSLFLGGAIAAAACVLGVELMIVVSGIWFLAETLSDILQVLSVQLAGKRIFKMSPLHHHLEMCGWSEGRIVLTATVITVLSCGVLLLWLL